LSKEAKKRLPIHLQSVLISAADDLKKRIRARKKLEKPAKIVGKFSSPP
jgi:hypothetical protein